MANKKNDTKEIIMKTAFRLFYENGYDKTTYQAIGDAIGKKRTIVQHHFPEKSIFPYVFLDRLNMAIESYLEDENHIKKNDLSSLYKLGQINFSFLLMDEKMKRFTKELIGKREYTVKLFSQNQNWIFDYFHDTSVLSDIPSNEIEENYVMVMGGTYEVLFDDLINNKDVKIAELLKKTMVSFFVSIGYDAKEVSNMMSENELSHKELTSAVKYLKNTLFSQ